ncbi:MAG: hypothetical protein HY615_17920 [Candidatus Rokubacteria bacterium]|nr:hypothetical protein [Candidatus Rokubacteria bacterium]
MEKFEYFSGTPEVGIVPRAPHAGPLLRHVYEQEHGRGGIMADFATPARVSEHAHALARPDDMTSWESYATDPRFAHRPDRLAEVRGLAERLADARDALRPRTGDA